MKLTEAKYLKLRKWNLCVCALAIIVYIFLIKYTMKVNPGAFIYNPVTDNVPVFAQIKTKLWWIIGVGWFVVIVLFMREVKKNPNHWARKIVKKLDELENDED